MPTITFSLKDLQDLVGKKITPAELDEVAEYLKGECEKYDKSTDEVTVSLDDTNLPYLWSVEGIARLLRGVYGLESGIPKINIKKGEYKIIVDKSVLPVRPHIAALVAKKKKIDAYFLKQLIQLQEKFCESYGRRRQKASVGIYSYKRIQFPVTFKAVLPDSVSFVPLESENKISLSKILADHPKGKEYGWILKDKKNYPLLVDSKNEVLSFPPVINSNFTGRVEVGDADILVEVTGEDEETVNLAIAIFAYALWDREFELYSVDIKYPNKTITTPLIVSDKIKIKEDDVENLLGLALKKPEVKKLLEKARYDFSDFTVMIPPYRKDIMHPFDVIEDVAIMYGFKNIKDSPLASYTVGETMPLVQFSDLFRELLVGLQYQEIMSQILSNKTVLFEKMNAKQEGVVEIQNYMSETYSVVRNALLPLMLEVFSKNKHVEYPQKIFEQGVVTINSEKIVDHELLALASAHKDANYTEIKQTIEYVLRALNIEFELAETLHASFIKGRAAKIMVKGKEIGIFGEISPAVLENWGIEMPAVGAELNISLLFELR